MRAIIRLIGDVCAIPGGHTEKKRQLMGGLCDMISADSWAWGVAKDVKPGEPSVHLSLLQGGFTDDSYAEFSKAYLHPGMSPIHATIMGDMKRTHSHVTRLRQQMDPTGISWEEPAGTRGTRGTGDLIVGFPVIRLE